MRAYLAQPEWLWLLAALPLLGWRVVVGRSRRLRDWTALGSPGGAALARDGAVGRLLACVCLVAALAQPRWGRTDRPPLPSGHDVVLAVDVSRSMAAEDAVPNRLGRAVEASRALLAELARAPGDRVAVVAFAGRGATRCPLTENLGAAVEALAALRPGALQPGGTDLGAAVDAALDAFDDQERAEGRTVVLVSDGEDHPGGWTSAAQRARERGVTLHTVAVGDAETGHPVPVPVVGVSVAGTTRPAVEPLRHRGAIVLSKRSDEALRGLAEITGGAFVPLGLATADLGRLYRERIEPTARARRAVDPAVAPQPAERFGIFLAAALGLGLASGRPGSRRTSASRTWLTDAAALGIATWLGLALGAAPGGDAASLVESGRTAFAAGRFDEALAAFQRASALAPGSPVPRFNAGEALLQLRRPAEARDAYREARRLASPALLPKIDYALGNTAVSLGDIPAAIQHYDDCLASTARGPGLDETRRRARGNKTYVEEHLDQAPSPSRSADGPNPDRRPESNPPGGDDRPDPDRGSRSGSGPGPEGHGGPNPPPGAPSGKSGGGPNASRSGSGTPESRLEQALATVRESRRSWVDDSASPSSAEESRDLEDW